MQPSTIGDGIGEPARGMVRAAAKDLPFGSAPAAPPLRFTATAQKETRIKIERLTDASVVRDIHSTLPSLEFRDLRLIGPYFPGEGPLSHADLFPMPDQAIDYSTVELIAFRVLARHVLPRNEVGRIGRYGLLCRIDLFHVTCEKAA